MAGTGRSLSTLIEMKDYNMLRKRSCGVASNPMPYFRLPTPKVNKVVFKDCMLSQYALSHALYSNEPKKSLPSNLGEVYEFSESTNIPTCSIGDPFVDGGYVLEQSGLPETDVSFGIFNNEIWYSLRFISYHKRWVMHKKTKVDRQIKEVRFIPDMTLDEMMETNEKINIEVIYE
jgi:hypothetical protein